MTTKTDGVMVSREDAALLHAMKLEKRKEACREYARNVVHPVMKDGKPHKLAALVTTVADQLEEDKAFTKKERPHFEDDLHTHIRNALGKLDGNDHRIYLPIGGTAYQQTEHAPEEPWLAYTGKLIARRNAKEQTLTTWEERYKGRWGRTPGEALDALHPKKGRESAGASATH